MNKDCSYCLNIYESTPASPRRNYKYCPMCGKELNFKPSVSVVDSSEDKSPQDSICEEVPFVAFGDNELRDNEDVGESVACPNCKELHEVKYGDRVLEDGTKVPSKILAFVDCPIDNEIYLVGVNGKLIRGGENNE